MRPRPEDFVPPSDALRLWRGVADDAAASVGQHTLQSFGGLRLADALEVSGVRVRVRLCILAWARRAR